jgi:AraC family transcriptional regulator
VHQCRRRLSKAVSGGVNVSPYPDISHSRESLGARNERRGSILAGVDVVRKGRPEPFLEASPTLSSSSVRWRGLTLNNYTVPAVLIPRHEHPEDFLHLVVRGTVRYEVNTTGRNFRFTSRPGTIFLLPHGTVDEVNWSGETQRVAVAIQPELLAGAMEEAGHGKEIELTEHWDLIDRHISALVMEMAADLEDSTPAGTLYGEGLANALAVYLLRRYAVRAVTAAVYKGGLPPYRLKRVLDFIGDSLEENISLSQLAAVAGMSPHYFSELFKQSTGRTPHNYVLSQRIERAKQLLQDQKHNIINAGLNAGFQNPSHFSRVFRKLVGTSPSHFRADYRPRG